MTPADRKQQLLEASIDYVAEHGFAGTSLRTLADALGTSHRMLIHHFGSKDGLWLAIVTEVERRQVELFAQFQAQAEGSTREAMRAWWRHLADPSLAAHERLFFEVYAQALQGQQPAVRLLDTVVESWVDTAADVAVAGGMARDDARALVRLGLAVTRGLLLDLLATGDRAGVDAAMEQWIELVAARL